METPITIKRYNSSSWDTLHPITVGQNVYGSGTKATTALLDSNNKLARDFLQLYEHNIKIYYATYNIILTFKFINNDSTEYCYDGTTSPAKTGYKELAKALYNAGYTSETTLCSANGIWGITNGSQNLIIGVYGYNNNTNDIRLYFRYVSLVTYSSGTTATINTSISENGTYYALSNSFTIKDKVRTL